MLEKCCIIRQSAAKLLIKVIQMLRSYLLNRAKAMIGYSVVGKIDFSEKDMISCLEKVTLPVFSNYLPYRETVMVHSENDRYPGKENLYLIKTPIDSEIIGVSRIYAGAMNNLYPFYHPYNQGDVLSRQNFVDMYSLFGTEVTFKFSPPNFLEVFPKSIIPRTGEFPVLCKFRHPTSLRTILPGSTEILKDLYLSDLATDLLGVREFFQTLSSAYGEIQLNLDRLRTHADERKEIIEKLRSSVIRASGAPRVFFA